MTPSASIEQLFAQALERDLDPNTSWEAISKLHARASQEVFDKSASCCISSDPWVRARGVDILAQLRISREQPTHPFERQAFDVITALLHSEQNEEPISAALTALGHIGRPEAVEHCIRFIHHHSARIRYAAAFALGCFANHAVAVEALLQLMTDEDASVRDWATFGLGVLGEVDSPEIRDALFLRTTDPDPDTREEAICGLAKRHDQRVIPILEQLLNQPEISHRIDEAAGFFPNLQSSIPNGPD